MFRKMYQGGSSRKKDPKLAMRDADDEPPRNALVHVGVQKEGYTFCTPITVHGQSEPRTPPHRARKGR